MGVKSGRYPRQPACKYTCDEKYFKTATIYCRSYPSVCLIVIEPLLMVGENLSYSILVHYYELMGVCTPLKSLIKPRYCYQAVLKLYI
jgi:hypothetical protein